MLKIGHVFVAKMNMLLKRDFALAGEIIYGHKVSFHAILLT